MKSHIRWIRAVLMVSVLAATSRAAEPFAVPAEISPPFRRDALPIDPDRISDLSDEITMLAQSGEMDSPPARRAVAQALALALALSPESSAADVLSDIADGKSLSKPDSNKLANAKTTLWQTYTWLASPDAGRDGNLLADLLGDTASSLDPGNPAADSLRGTLEKGKWNGWVAPVTAFEKRKQPVPEVIVKNDPVQEPEKPPEKLPETKLPSTLKSSNASIITVLSDYQANTDTYLLGPATVRMEATPPEDGGGGDWEEDSDEGRKFRIRISCWDESRHDVFENVTTPITKALESLYHDRIPKGSVRIRSGASENYSFKRNGDDMTGPGFILANSAITGIAPDAIFIGKLDGSHKLKLPAYFWRKLVTLADGPGGRLVVPSEAEPYLTALLAVEKPEFFMKYEVLLASSPEEAVRLCAKVPDAELAAAQAKFKEIKDKAGTTALGNYLANSFVRKRLVEVSQSAPYHLSAKLLAIQGAGARPRSLDKQILAAEIFEAIDPVTKYTEVSIYSIDSNKVAAMESLFDAATAHLSRIERYAELRDRELVSNARDVISKLRTISRVYRGRGELWEKESAFGDAQREMADADRACRRALAAITGDPLPRDE